MPTSGVDAMVARSAEPSIKELDMVFWDVVASIFWFMILFTWIGMLMTIFGDLFRDHEMSGWGKALWTLFLIVVPWLGALVYLNERGRSINERARAQAQRNEQELRRYVRETATADTTSTADELAKLADLRDRGTISAEEFQHAKAKVLGSKEPEPAPSASRREHAVPSTT
jgi:ABC-type multidrug transport system fused ATPase/permease subunit